MIRSIKAAALVGTGVILGVIATLLLHGGAPKLGGSDETQDIIWKLVGVGRDGRSLIVRPDADFDACYEPPTVVVVQADADAIDLRMRIRRRCSGDAMPALAQLFGPVTVPLRVAVRGQRIDGLNYAGAGAAPGRGQDATSVSPSVRGLALHDARDILTANRMAIGRLRLGDGRVVRGAAIVTAATNGDGYIVTEQQPGGGTRVPALAGRPAGRPVRPSVTLSVS